MPTRMVTAASLLVACCLSKWLFPLGDPIGRAGGRRHLGHEHVSREACLSARDTKIAGPLVSHGEKPADPARNGVLGQRRGGGAGRGFWAGRAGVGALAARGGA